MADPIERELFMLKLENVSQFGFVWRPRFRRGETITLWLNRSWYHLRWGYWFVTIRGKVRPYESKVQWLKDHAGNVGFKPKEGP